MVTPLPLAALVALAIFGMPGGAAAAAGFHHALPPENAVKVRRGIAYAPGDSGAVLDLYRPASAGTKERLPVLLFLNSRDGSSFRDWDLYTAWARLAASRGFAAILADPGRDFAKGFPVLLAHLRREAPALGVDPDRIGAYAASGNASGALPVLQDPDHSAVRGAVIFYGTGAVEEYRPDLPILFVRAGLDRPGLNRNLDAAFARALEQNAPVQLLNYAGGHHGFETADDNPMTAVVIDAALEFLARALAPETGRGLRAGIPEAGAAAAYARGDFAGAAGRYAELVAGRPDDATLRLAYGEALLAAKRFGDARREFERLRGAGLGYRDLGVPAARAAALDGDPDAAVAWLQTIPARFRPGSLREDPDFAPLRERPDFRALFQ